MPADSCWSCWHPHSPIYTLFRALQAQTRSRCAATKYGCSVIASICTVDSLTTWTVCAVKCWYAGVDDDIYITLINVESCCHVDNADVKFSLVCGIPKNCHYKCFCNNFLIPFKVAPWDVIYFQETVPAVTFRHCINSSCAWTGRVGRPLFGRSAVWFPAAPIWMLKCPWARYNPHITPKGFANGVWMWFVV